MDTQLSTYRRKWNHGQKQLRAALEGGRRDEAVELFMAQQGTLHSAGAAPETLWSFEDLLLEDISEEVFRRIPQGEAHSIAWLLWHIARCEDITFNVLTAGRAQVLEDWQARLNIKARDTGNAMSSAEIVELSAAIDLEALRGYRAAVGRATREIVHGMNLEQINAKVDPARIELILDKGYVLPAAIGIAEYWGSRTIAGLMLMPATRHNMTHINECFHLKTKK